MDLPGILYLQTYRILKWECRTAYRILEWEYRMFGVYWFSESRG